MLAELRQGLPGVEAHEGSAEAIPVPDASVDAAVAGQAYHWFDPEAAPGEIRRVLRPGGGLGLLWNWCDVRDPLQHRLTELLDSPHDPTFEPLPGPPFFEELARTTVESVLETTPDGLVARLATTSGVITAAPEQARALLDEVAALAAARGDRLALSQLTYVFAFRRL
jgi:SAM-dependent methyltransferase